MTTMQDSLFDAAPLVDRTRIEVDRSAELDLDALASWAFLYTATAKGNNSSYRFMMSTEDARAWCSSSISSGVLHGTPWAYFWTTVANYCDAYGPEIDPSTVIDNGSWDGRIASLGLTKIEPRDWDAILEPYGVEIVRVGAIKGSL